MKWYELLKEGVLYVGIVIVVITGVWAYSHTAGTPSATVDEMFKLAIGIAVGMGAGYGLGTLRRK
jgi:hypothetical protein